MSKATTHLDDVEKPDYSGDGKSSIEIFETTPHLAPPDGENTFGAPDVAGADRILESVENDILDVAATEQTSEATHLKPKAEPKAKTAAAPAAAKTAPKAAAPKADDK